MTEDQAARRAAEADRAAATRHGAATCPSSGADAAEPAVRGDAERETPPIRRGSAASPRVTIGGIGLVAAGGAVGSLARWALTAFVFVTDPAGWPLGTLLVNVLGACALGMLLTALPVSPRAERARLLLGTGVLGGFTTYSLLATQIAEQLLGGEVWLALGYGLTTLVGGATATLLGVGVATALTRRRAVSGISP